MKALGIVRRIDSLGRVVIPKEWRRTMGIMNGEPLEIFVDDNCVVLKKYERESDVYEKVKHLCREVEFATDMDDSIRAKVLDGLREAAKALNQNYNDKEEL